MLKLALAAFLIAHGLIHASFLSPRPAPAANGPEWPFELARSWILTPVGVPGDAMRMLGFALVALTVAGFATAALSVMGIGPLGLWMPAVVVGAASSIALLVLFFHPWLTLGVAIDLVLAWVVLVSRWSPVALPS